MLDCCHTIPITKIERLQQLSHAGVELLLGWHGINVLTAAHMGASAAFYGQARCIHLVVVSAPVTALGHNVRASSRHSGIHRDRMHGTLPPHSTAFDRTRPVPVEDVRHRASPQPRFQPSSKATAPRCTILGLFVNFINEPSTDRMRCTSTPTCRTRADAASEPETVPHPCPPWITIQFATTRRILQAVCIFFAMDASRDMSL